MANSGEHGHAIIAVLQAEVLLANYFFSLGRFLEGKYHTSAATSLAITCRLNSLGVPQNINPLGMNLIHGQYMGFTAADNGGAVNQGERVNAFWTVYILDKCWSVALGSPPSIAENSSHGVRISTPWPLSMAQYEQVRMAPHDRYDPLSDIYHGQSVEYTGQLIVPEFLNSTTIGSLQYFSPIALRAQACILFAHASSLASRYRNSSYFA